MMLPGRRRTRGEAPRLERMVSVITRLADGGSERRLHDVLDALPDVEHVVLVGEGSSPSRVAQVARDHEVHVLESLVRSVDPARDRRALTDLHRRFRDRSFDAVFTHQSKAGLLGRIAGRIAGVDRIYHSSSGANFGPGFGRIEGTAFRVAERMTAPLVDRYFVVGEDLAARLRRNGISARKIEIVRSSLDLDAFRNTTEADRARARAEFDLDRDAAVVCIVGRLDNGKGADHVVPCIERIQEQVPHRRVRALIAGEGPHRAVIEQQLANNPTQRDAVTLLGHTDRVAAVMQASDLIVLLSTAEGLPQVLVQAAAANLPFVAYAVDGTEELLSMGASGTTVAVGDQSTLEVAAASALRSPGVRRPRSLPDANGPAVDLSGWDPVEVRRRYRAILRPADPNRPCPGATSFEPPPRDPRSAH